MPDVNSTNNSSQVGLYTGATKTAKYAYQAGRAVRGLATTTRVTAAVDILAGSIDASHAHSAAGVVKGVDSATKGVTGMAKFSKVAKIAQFAGKAAPILTKGSCILGAAIGGWDIGQGISNIVEGNTAKGKEQIVSGTADVVTSGALAVAATSSGTIVGLPVAGVALGVAAGAQAVKYGYKYRHEIANGAKWVGNQIVDGAKWTGRQAVAGAQAVVDGAKWAGGKVVDGAVYVGTGIASGARAAGKGIVAGANWVADKAGKGYEAVKDTAGKVGDTVADGAKKLAEALKFW